MAPIIFFMPCREPDPLQLKRDDVTRNTKEKEGMNDHPEKKEVEHLNPF